MSPVSGVRSALYVLLVLAVAAVSVVAVLVDAQAAVRLLAALLALVGLLRWFAPDSLVPPVRSRLVDVTLLLGFAVALWLLAPWGNATLNPG